MNLAYLYFGWSIWYALVHNYISQTNAQDVSPLDDWACRRWRWQGHSALAHPAWIQSSWPGEEYAITVMIFVNIARGTRDPGYWVYNLNHFSGWNKFEIILAEKDHSSYGLNTLGPLCLWQCFLKKFWTFCQLFFPTFLTFNLLQLLSTV